MSVGEAGQTVELGRVLAVNDGSTDATPEIAVGHGATVLNLPYNLGIGSAMQTGFMFAHERGYEYAVQVDGDGQHDPDEILELLQALNREQGKTIVMVTHDIHAAARASRTLYLNKGQLTTEPEDLAA